MTPLGLLIAIVVGCIVCSALMIFVMAAASPAPTWYRRLNLGSVGAGLLFVLFGLFEFAIARKAEKTGKLTYHRGALVTSAQRYAVAAGFVTLGLTAAVVALLHRKRRSHDVSPPPTIPPNTSETEHEMIQIEPFAPRHADGVGALIVGIQRDEFQIPITLEEQPDLQNIPPFYQQGAGNFWVAVLDNEVVGTLALLDLGNHRGALRKMFVHASYRGPAHGVSARLLDTLLEWARARGVKEVYLGTTEKFLAAHRFYERNGFQRIAATELPPTFPKMVVDTRFYRRAP